MYWNKMDYIYSTISSSPSDNQTDMIKDGHSTRHLYNWPWEIIICILLTTIKDEEQIHPRAVDHQPGSFAA
jgi:hypothetical protein